jgi:hypothetical protein
MKQLLFLLSLILLPQQSLAMSCGHALVPEKLLATKTSSTPILDLLTSKVLDGGSPKDLKSIHAIPELKDLFEEMFGQIIKDRFSPNLSPLQFYNLLVHRMADLTKFRDNIDNLIQLYGQNTLFPASPELLEELRKLSHSLNSYSSQVASHIVSIDQRGPDLPAPQHGFDLVWQGNMRKFVFSSLAILFSEFQFQSNLNDFHERKSHIGQYYSRVWSKDLYLVKRPSDDGKIEVATARSHHVRAISGHEREFKAPIFIFFEEPPAGRKIALQDLNAQVIVIRSILVGP